MFGNCLLCEADVIENFFSLFCLTWQTVLKMWTRLFQKEQVKELKNVKLQDIYNCEKMKSKPKSSFVDVENAIIRKKILETAMITVEYYMYIHEARFSSIKQIDSILLCIHSVLDHRRYQNVTH